MRIKNKSKKSTKLPPKKNRKNKSKKVYEIPIKEKQVQKGKSVINIYGFKMAG